MPQNFEFIQNPYPPSNGGIKTKLEAIIRGTCGFMRSSGPPFLVNIYEFPTRKDNRGDVSLEYCLFTANRVVVQDGRYGTPNIFDAMIDALHVALDTANAQIFNQNMINHCKSGAGTPRNPDKPIRCFVFEMHTSGLG